MHNLNVNLLVNLPANPHHSNPQFFFSRDSQLGPEVKRYNCRLSSSLIICCHCLTWKSKVKMLMPLTTAEDHELRRQTGHVGTTCCHGGNPHHHSCGHRTTSYILLETSSLTHAVPEPHVPTCQKTLGGFLPSPLFPVFLLRTHLRETRAWSSFCFSRGAKTLPQLERCVFGWKLQLGRGKEAACSRGVFGFYRIYSQQQQLPNFSWLRLQQLFSLTVLPTWRLHTHT